MIATHYFKTKMESGAAAAELGAKAIRAAIEARGRANVVIATGASQFEMLAELTTNKDIDWSVVTAFHLDEYVGIAATDKASFRRYLRERFTSKLPALGAFHFIEGDAADLAGELDRLNTLIDRHPLDVTFAGIGENGHLAFNDPPADFTTTVGYQKVGLDAACRLQQVREGWFPDLLSVPAEAISMTVQRILSSQSIIVTASDERKAEAIQHVLEGEITNMWPASILQSHARCHLFLDPGAASRLA